MAQPRLIVRIEHEETAAARANELASKCPVFHRTVVPFIDSLIGHALRSLLLPLPMDIHEPREFVQISVLKRNLTLFPKLFDKMQIFDHRLVRLPGFVILLF